jgi:EAL domain-containing protein (putative c-di-GMP-specific phosphodiesterase class I)
MIARVFTSRSVLLLAAAVGSLVGISVLRFTVGSPGIMLFAVVPIALLGMMYGVRGGLGAAAVAAAVFLVWVFTRGDRDALRVIEEPFVFFVLGLVAGIYAKGAFGDCDPRHAVQRADLRRAIRQGEVVFHYQPLADARTRSVVGFEALARWQHPDHGLVAPGTFIALAEGDERTIWELTLLAVDRSLADLAAWGEIARDLTISINVSPVSLTHRDLAREFSRVVERHGLPASRLAVEVTETALATSPGRAADAIAALKAMGMTIVLDDFGTGHSSISRLGRLAIDELKVDLNLIGPPSDANAHRVLAAIVEMARALELQVAAEWVEDDETWDQIERLGYDLVQGARLSLPLPADRVPGWLQVANRSSVARLP